MKHILIFLFVFFSFYGFGQISLLKDVIVDYPWRTFSSPPPIINSNGSVFFFGGHDAINSGLWKSNGTPEGTVFVEGLGDLNNFTTLNGMLYFTAQVDTTGIELWRSDGTREGTTLIKDINPGPSSSYPSSITIIKANLYFTADDGIHGVELWKSDGTTSGTLLVMDINSGDQSAFKYSEPFIGTRVTEKLSNIQDVLYFNANDGSNGYEPWRSDGTETGTKLMKNIASGSASSSPSKFVGANGILYFSAIFDTLSGVRLNRVWKSDGTEAGTETLRSNMGHLIDGPDYLTNIDGLLYVMTNSGELWSSNGVKGGTILIGKFGIGRIIKLNNGLYFVDRTRYEATLWKINETTSSLSVIKSWRGGTAIGIQDPTIVKDQLYFFVTDLYFGGQFLPATLWKSDGRICGTVKAAENGPVDIHGFYPMGKNIFIIGYEDGIGSRLYLHNTDDDIPLSSDCQTISFNPILTKTFGDPPFSVSAAASSGLPITFTSSNTSIASVSNNIVTLLKAGEVSIIASQAGDTYYKAAVDAEQTFCVNPPKPVITVSQSDGMSLLTSSGESGNHWYKDGIELISESGQDLSILTEGLYAVQISIGGCTSEFSDEITWTRIAQQNIDSNKLLIIYPTLATQQIRIILDDQPEKKEFSIMQGNGLTLLRQTMNTSQTEVDISGYAAGLYIVHVQTNLGHFTGKFFKK